MARPRAPAVLRDSSAGALPQLFHQRLEPRMLSEGVEVAVVLVPALLSEAVSDGPLQAVERFVDFAGKGINAPQVIEEHRLLGRNIPGAAGPLETLLRLAEGDEQRRLKVIGPDLARLLEELSYLLQVSALLSRRAPIAASARS